MIAQLGGYVNVPGRKDMPGVQTLWIGMQRMRDLAWAWEYVCHWALQNQPLMGASKPARPLGLSWTRLPTQSWWFCFISLDASLALLVSNFGTRWLGIQQFSRIADW